MKNRREFLEFMGKLSLASAAGSAFPILASCASKAIDLGESSLPFHPLSPSFDDAFLVAKGFEFDLLIKEGDPLKAQLQFGSCNDFTAFFPLDNLKDEALLWVNHEYSIPLFSSGYLKSSGLPKTPQQCEAERKVVGGSVLHIKKKNHRWEIVPNSSRHLRLDANSPIPFAGNKEVFGAKIALGTLGNCAGGITPWGTVLTCEENYQHFYGEVNFDEGLRKTIPSKHNLSWTDVSPRPPEHYGWVVEVQPQTGEAKKLTSLGRFAHEGATCTLSKNNRTVVYLGDDNENECFYKFISKNPGSLEEGTLYVANFEKGRWIPITLANPLLKNHFSSEMDLKIRTREAAARVGGSRLDRPEDCEIDPINGAIYLCCTNNDDEGRPYGAILKIVEKDNDYEAEEFTVAEFLPGGKDFACPDNIAFDKKGNLWMTSDMASEKIGLEKFKRFGNNGLYYIPLSGPQAGEVFQVASAPVGAELTGPCFSADGETLFLSVQHPGEGRKDLTKPTSRWPLYKDHLPLSSVVQISGPALKALTKS